MNRLLRDAMIVARRDYFAVVGTPTFLLFLLSPLLMIVFGLIGGLGAAQMGKSAGARREIVAIVAPADQAMLRAADGRLRRTASPMLPKLAFEAPKADVAAQGQDVLNERDREVSAVLYGPLERPHLTYPSAGAFSATYMESLAEEAVRARRSGIASDKPVIEAVRNEIKPKQARQSTQQASGYGAVFVIFLLTLLLAGQSVGMLSEEKSNKVIEILVAAIRIEAIFIGKLVGLFGVAMTFVAFWATLMGGGVALLPITMMDILTDYTPAIGLPLFFFFGTLYFIMAFMLLGAMFLGMGAIAASQREIQLMSLPITALQVGVFSLANAAASNPGSGLATFAEWFPFSAPFAMAARGAVDASITPHLIALSWQTLWVGIVIYVASAVFKRGVLKTGGSLFRKKVAATSG